MEVNILVTEFGRAGKRPHNVVYNVVKTVIFITIEYLYYLFLTFF